MSTLPMFRMRAGFYVTRDGNYRIVRRKLANWPKLQWCIERWSHESMRWERLTERHSLAEARNFLEVELALAWWRSGE